ncbi:MAG: hypothetical protein ABIS59_01845 [Candidatus Saccharibacteria bacterium]
MNAELATEATKATLENNVSWFLSEKLAASNMPIATNKYITGDNVLIYITKCNVSDASAPRIKVQVLKRITGGVHESSYQLFNDQRLTRTDNQMIFGAAEAGTPTDLPPADVTESEAQELIKTVNALSEARTAL